MGLVDRAPSAAHESSESGDRVDCLADGGWPGDGVKVWDSAEAVADFFIERVNPIPETEREAATKPTRHGEPIAVYLRAT
jgi:hypothetical protein